MASITDPVQYLRTPIAIRERCQQIFDLGLKGELNHFTLNMPRLPGVAELVKSETFRQYPTLEVPHIVPTWEVPSIAVMIQC